MILLDKLEKKNTEEVGAISTTNESSADNDRLLLKALDAEVYSFDTKLWDQIDAIKEQQDLKSKQMQALKTFFKSYRKSLDVFKDGVRKAVTQYEKDIIVPQSKRGYKHKEQANRKKG